VPTTTRLSLPYPASSAGANVPADMQALANALDPLVPDSNQQAALAGTAATPGATNKFVTDQDPRNTNQRVPTDGSVNDAKVSGGIAPSKIAGTAVTNGDARLSDARAPTAHAASHQEGGSDDIGLVPIGGIIPYTGQALPAGGKWDWADGGLIDRTTFGTFFAKTGHAYNGGVDPGSNMVRKPDKRGRVSRGADSFGAGAAGRVVSSPAGRGQNGGSERVTLAATESGIAAHSHSSPAHGHSVDFQLGGIFSPQTPGGAAIHPTTIPGQFSGVNIPWADNSNPWGGNNSGHAHNLGGTGVTINNAGPTSAAAAHQNLSPYENDNYIVRIA
jgi:hypothetical protein